MIKILTIVGARPQFIKSAAISRAITNHFNNKIEEIIVHTGQHYDPNMSDIFFTELNIPKEKYNLEIGSGNHANQTAQIMIKLDEVVNTEKPDAILVYGDTNSTLAAVLVAIKRHIHTIHIESGVRSYNKRFPEEVNRIICDHMSSLLFVPSDAGIDSLKKEGFSMNDSQNTDLLNNPKVIRCGDIMYDNTLYFEKLLANNDSSIFKKYALPENDFILVTAHRPSNVDKVDTFKSIIASFEYAISKHGKSIIFPVHPRTEKFLQNNTELKEKLENNKIFIIPAVSFLDIISLQKKASLIMTDSGGVQKEAYFLEKPCLIMLDETPWVELVESGNAKLVGSNYDLICSGMDEFITESDIKKYPKIYGDGKAAEHICEEIIKYIN